MNPLIKLVVLCAVVFCWYKFVTPPAAGAVPESAYRDAENGFAIIKPDGWELAKQDGCGGPFGACAAAELYKNVDGIQPKPSLQVSFLPGAPLRISEGSKADLSRRLGVLSGQMARFEADPEKLIEVDELAALKVEGRGTRHERVETSPAEYANERMALERLKKEHPNQSIFWIQREIKGPRDTPSRVLMKEAQYEERDLSLTLGSVLVSGGKKTYLLHYAFDSNKEREYGQAVQDMLGSFRVLDRQSPFQAYGGFMGSVPGDAILGALVGLTIAAWKILTA